MYAMPDAGFLLDSAPIAGTVPPWIFVAMEAAKRKYIEKPFDLFAAIFFMLSRCEEYGFEEVDRWNRFPAQASAAMKHGVLTLPIVDLWLQLLANKVKEFYPSVTLCLTMPSPAFQPSFDIDRAFAYKHRGLPVQIGAIFKKLLSRKWQEAALIWKVCTGYRNDPWDTYTLMADIHASAGITPLFFMLLNHQSNWIEPIGHANKAWRKLTKALDTYGEIGLHPSIDASSDFNLLLQEKAILEEIVQRPIQKVRQHFLTIRMPNTYRLFHACGLEQDYSMGFPEQVGYRAGTGRSFPFFDLDGNQETNLTIVPFVAMDTTLRQYMGYSPLKAESTILTLAEQGYRAGTPFMLLFHNESLGGFAEWNGWEKVYANCVDGIVKMHNTSK
jgi:hypothetical protein